MPRFNSRGQVCAGVGDGIISIDRVEVARGGGAEWLDDDRVIFGGHWTDGTWKLLCYDQRTRQVTTLDDCEVQELVGSGGEYFAVGARSLAASFPLASQLLRLTPTSTDGRGAGDRQGTIALSDRTGQGFTLRATDGREVSAAAGVACYSLTVVSATQAFWPANGGFDSIGLPPIKVVGPPGRGCYCVVSGRPWVVYYRDGLGLITHPADDASRIQVIESAPIFFHYDAIAKDGTIRVTYATTASEAPHEVVIRNLDLSQLAPVRNREGTDLNTDALTYLRSDGRFEIYDVINGGSGGAAWDVYGPFSQGENGYWVEQGGVVEPPKPPAPDLTALIARIDKLERDINALFAENNDLKSRVADLEQQPAPAVDLSPYAKKGDAVTVTGRTSIFGVNRWTGTIDK
jgi:hypothetical protein